MEPTPLKRPDITAAQVVGFVAAAIALAIAFGVDLDAQQQDALLGFTGVVASLLFGDAIIRNGRSKIAAAQVTADAAQPVVQVVPAGHTDGDDSLIPSGPIEPPARASRGGA